MEYIRHHAETESGQSAIVLTYVLGLAVAGFIAFAI